MGSLSLRHFRAAAVWFLLLEGLWGGWAFLRAQEPARPMPAAQPPTTQTTAAPPAAASQPSPGQSAPAAVREEEPSIYLLPDGKGEYQKVINYPLEQFKRLLELERQLEAGSGKPAYAIEMTGNATAEGSRAKLELEFAISVPADGWVRVPLRLDEAVILSQQHQGAGEHFLVPADDAQGYIAWLRGGTGEPHRLKITAFVPISRIAGESHLRLALPRLTTSEFKLRVPVREAVVQTPQNAILERLPTINRDETLVRAVGTSGALDLAWRETPSEPGQRPVALSATGAIQIQLDGQAATTTAVITVAAGDAAVEGFQVLLPAGATLISGAAAGYTVAPAVAAAPNTDDRGAVARIDVRPLEKADKQVELKLVTEQLLPSGGAIDFVDLAGFEVAGARLQTGFMALRVVGDWQLVFGERRNIREVTLGDLPPSLRSNEVATGFEYLAQPGSLLARVVPRRPRVAVEPTYLYQVTADALELTARLRYTIRGARVFALEVELPDESWEIDEIGPAGLVDLDGVLFEQLQPLSIPLLQPGSGELELRIRAHRRLDVAQASFAFKLPRPLANSVGPAKVIVLPADNIELAVRGDEIVGLGRPALSTEVDLPPHQQEPLVYRGDVDRAVFAADWRVLKQAISAQIATQVVLGEPAGRVEQSIKYRIRHEPVQRLSLRAPRELLGARREVELLLDGQRVQWQAERELDETTDPTQLVQIPLATPLIGSSELIVRYSIGEQKLVPRVSVPLAIPLVAPAGIADVRHEASVVAQPGLDLTLRGDQWRAVQDSRGVIPTGDHLRLATDLPVNDLALAISLADPEAFGATVVERAWLQSWLGAERRQDRVALRISSRQASLGFELPEGAVPATVEVRLDGERVTAQADRNGRYTVRLTRPATTEQRLIEIAYDVAHNNPRKVRLAPPRLGEDVRFGNTYWQVVLPKDHHVVSGPANYGAEFSWGWQGYYWGRQPELEQFELEAWTGAAHRTALPNTTNRYLYSTLGSPAPFELRIVPRWFIVLAASGAALVAGLALIYVPQLRQPLLLGVAALGVLALGAVYPEPTLMILQAASLGALLTLVSGVLKKSLAKRTVQRAGSTLIRPGSSIARRTEVEPVFRSATAGSNSSTETGPLAGQLAGPDSKS